MGERGPEELIDFIQEVDNVKKLHPKMMKAEPEIQKHLDTAQEKAKKRYDVVKEKGKGIDETRKS